MDRGAARSRKGTAARNKTKFSHAAAWDEKISQVKIMLYVAWQLCLERTWE